MVSLLQYNPFARWIQWQRTRRKDMSFCSLNTVFTRREKVYYNSFPVDPLSKDDRFLNTVFKDIFPLFNCALVRVRRLVNLGACWVAGFFSGKIGSPPFPIL